MSKMTFRKLSMNCFCHCIAFFRCTVFIIKAWLVYIQNFQDLSVRLLGMRKLWVLEVVVGRLSFESHLLILILSFLPVITIIRHLFEIKRKVTCVVLGIHSVHHECRSEKHLF